MHPALDDQTVYDVIFSLYRAVVILAGESNDTHQAYREMAVRALKAEAMLRNTRIERDYWKARVDQVANYKLRWRARKRVA